jgi:voltage-gated potassium channel
VTITTVGYGDRFPTTTGGRAIGLAMMTLGIGIFGVLTSFMSNVLLAPPKTEQSEGAPAASASALAPEPSDLERLHAEMAGLRDELAEIKALLRDRQSV